MAPVCRWKPWRWGMSRGDVAPGVEAGRAGVAGSRTHILRGEEHRSQHLLGVCLSFVPIPALLPPPLSSFHLCRPKNRATAQLDLLLAARRAFSEVPSAARRGPAAVPPASLSCGRAAVPSGRAGVPAPPEFCSA